MQPVGYSSVRITGGFWQRYQELVRNVTIKSIYDRFDETGRFQALSCSRKEGEAGKPHIYWDSDVAKWIEAAAYLTALKRSEELEELIDSAVSEIEKNQMEDGYYNSYYITCEPENRFTVRENHELYCAGHLIEAAVAYAEATGKETFLRCMIRYADLIYRVFYEEKSAPFFTPGHEEIELALLRLYEYTGEEKYLRLSAYFIEERGKHPEERFSKVYIPGMLQSDEPVRKMKAASGHAVRANYLYTAAAHLAQITEDEELKTVCRNLFSNITEKKMSVTGGVGACMAGEAYDYDYILPNRSSYNETCAAIALTMFAEKMQGLEPDRNYADVIERVLYNGMLSGISLSGDSFFYENALEIDRRDYDHTLYDMNGKTAAETHKRGLLHERRLARAKVFSTSCCPPNIARTIASMGRFLYQTEGSTIRCNQFAESEAELAVGGKKAVLRQKTRYPEDGNIKFLYEGEPAVLYVRIPSWCTEYDGETENGYVRFELTGKDEIILDLPMKVHFLSGNPHVCDFAGKCAVQRGPVVYCMEALDNGEELWNIELDMGSEGQAVKEDWAPAPVLKLRGVRTAPAEELYSAGPKEKEPCEITMIPYFTFANRGITDMQIWTLIR